MRQFSGVFLHVRALDGNCHDISIVEFDLERPFERNRFVELRDLVILGEVGVEIVLPGEPAGLGDLTPEGKPERNRVPNSVLVDDRQASGESEANRGHRRVRVGTENVGRTREHLGLCRQFDVNLESDDRLEFFQCLVEIHQCVLGHQFAPPVKAGVSAEKVEPRFASSSASMAAPTS
ncbi:unannotated protein [freshwater metagenome]|uniref:Unannotated protein n=1 Tax=freshwater metagenome TaxID=449393 RepID=A0A6J7DNF7_9ZZZZ